MARKRPPRKRNKGSPFEREICRKLSDWWTGDPTRDVIFWRTAGSGGRATTRGKKGHQAAKEHCGDIAALDAEGAPLTSLITFEVKRGYNNPRDHCLVHDLLDKPTHAGQQGLEAWVLQAQRSAVNASTPFWAIIHRRDQREAVVLMPTALYDSLGRFVLPTLALRCRVEASTGERSLCEIAAVTLDAFLVGVTPRDVRDLAADHTSVRGLLRRNSCLTSSTQPA